MKIILKHTCAAAAFLLMIAMSSLSVTAQEAPGTAENPAGDLIDVNDEAAVSENVIGVIYFQNTGADAAYDPLQQALTDMIITDLSQVPSLTLVERTRMALLLQEKEFSVSDVHTEENRGAAAADLGAAKTLTGSFSVDADKKLKIDASFINTEDGTLEETVSAQGEVGKFFKLEKELVFSIVDNMGIKLTDEERLKIQVIPTENLLALLAYGRGIDAQDRGDFAAAAKAFNEAAALDPDFKEAGEMAKKSAADRDNSVTEGKETMEYDGSGPNVIDAPEAAAEPVAAPAKTGFLKVNSFTNVISSRAGGAFMPEVAVGVYTSGKSPAERAQDKTHQPDFSSESTVKTEYSDFKGLGVGDGLEEFNVPFRIPVPEQ